MHSATVDIFFSCSFRDEDRDINEFILAICRALNLNPTNVSTGYSSTPPQVAKEKIERSQAVIAVCTNRDELKAGGFMMPQAVHDEISFAYGKDIPVLMIKEREIVVAGFKENFGTFLEFDRTRILGNDFVQKVIEAIHGLKLDVLGPHQLGTESGISDARADWVHHLIELKRDEKDFVWYYSTSKKITFLQPSKRSFPSQVWAIVPQELSGTEPPMSYSLTVKNSSRGITLEDRIEEHTACCVKSMMRLVPPAEEGDFVEYESSYSSRYLNPVWLDEAVEGSMVHLDAGDYACADGIVFIHRTKNAIIEFRFPREYGLRRSDVRPFVGSYTSSLDYEVTSELERASIKIEEFAGNLVIRMELESPLPGHMYGVAWHPRARPMPVSG